MWTEWEWQHRDVQILFAAVRHERNKRLDQWRQQRFRAYIDAKFGGMSALKNGVSIEQFYPLPGDVVKPKELATMRFMSREEIKEKYARGGITFTEEELDRMMEKIERAKEKERQKKAEQHAEE